MNVMADPEPLDVAVRAHTVRVSKPTRPFATSSSRKLPVAEPSGDVLVFDCETTTDPTQSLLFGCWRYYRCTPDGLVCAEEGLFYSDDLPETRPAEFAILRDTTAMTASSAEFDGARVRLLSRSQFISQVFYPAAYDNCATVVGFNLPFDIARIAIDATPGRGRDLGGFSFILAEGNKTKGHKERKHLPRVQVKHLNSHAAFIRFATPYKAIKKWKGDFVDLRTLTFGLTGKGHSLKSACAAFGSPDKADTGEHGTITADYIRYARRDVQCTAELYRACIDALHALGLPIRASDVYSSASLAKSVLDVLGITPHHGRPNPLSDDMHGAFMSAFYGGRAECRIRQTEVPVSLLDFTSMYPTVFALMNLHRYSIAAQVGTSDATELVRGLLATVAENPDVLFDPAIWHQLVGIALLKPDSDIVPIRARYNSNKESYNIASSSLTDDKTSLWFPIADLIASAALTRRPPKISRAVRLTAHGQLPGLTPWTMPGGRVLDPTVDSPWPAMIEHRQQVRNDQQIPKTIRDRIQLFLKITSNAGGFGIYAEQNPQRLPKSERAQVEVYDGTDETFLADTSAPEQPGRYAFPPLAAVITGAARLLLAMLEREVTNRGGSWAFADTDSMAIVATKQGGLIPCAGGAHRDSFGQEYIRALTQAQVNDIRARFQTLNPYLAGTITDLVKHELDAIYYGVAAKRYPLYRYDSAGLPRLVPADEHEPCSHGVGHLLNPTDPDSEDRDWIVQFWEHELLKRLTNQTPKRPAWFDRPALGKLAITSPVTYKGLDLYNQAKKYQKQIKPFGFMLHAPGAEGFADEDIGRLITPYTTKASTWSRQSWIDLNEPDRRHKISTDPTQPGRVLIDSYESIAQKYFTHIEAKALSPGGSPCARDTHGLLGRRHVTIKSITRIGKEANELDERASNVSPDPNNAPRLAIYYRRRRGTDLNILAELQRVGPTELARRTGLSARRIADVLAARSTPRHKTVVLLTRALTICDVNQGSEKER
jgi:hypothetical protein